MLFSNLILDSVIFLNNSTNFVNIDSGPGLAEQKDLRAGPGRKLRPVDISTLHTTVFYTCTLLYTKHWL